MNLLRKLLFPFAVLYGAVTGIRNFLFDKGILQSHSFKLPVIAVGNLSVGGTGKSPQIEYLIRLLSSKYKVATLSRGYKRESQGFVLAKANATAGLLGDEPYQFFRKFKNIQVAVDSDRNNGINQLLSQAEIPEGHFVRRCLPTPQSKSRYVRAAHSLWRFVCDRLDVTNWKLTRK